jgi:SPW repeat
MSSTELNHENRIRVFSAIEVLLGIWLVITPWVVGAPGQRVATSGIVVGAIAILCGLVRFARKHTMVFGWVVVLAGAWTIMSPWVLGQEQGYSRTWNYVIVGVLLALIEAYSLTSSTTQPNWRQHETGQR